MIWSMLICWFRKSPNRTIRSVCSSKSAVAVFVSQQLIIITHIHHLHHKQLEFIWKKKPTDALLNTNNYNTMQRKMSLTIDNTIFFFFSRRFAFYSERLSYSFEIPERNKSQKKKLQYYGKDRVWDSVFTHESNAHREFRLIDWTEHFPKIVQIAKCVSISVVDHSNEIRVEEHLIGFVEFV